MENPYKKDTMLAELFEKLKEVADLQQAHVVPGTPEPKHVYRIERRDGTIEICNAAPQPRDHKALDLTAVVEHAKLYSDSCIWYSRSGVVAILNNSDSEDEGTPRLDRVSLTLSFSPQILKLLELERNRKPLTQKELVSLIRTTFADCCPVELRPAISELKFKSTAEGASKLTHGTTSVGKLITAEVKGGGSIEQIPETFTLNVPIFASGFPSLQKIEVILEIDAQEEKFYLTPKPLDIEDAISRAEEEIHDELTEQMEKDAKPIYYGTP